MEDLYKKLIVIISQILLYGKNVRYVTKPKFLEEDIYIQVALNDDSYLKDIYIPYASLIKLHDHGLDSYVFHIMKEENLV